MRSLRLTNVAHSNFKESVSNARCMAIDYMRGILYIANGKDVYGIDQVSQEVISTTHVCDCDDILSIEYLIDQEMVCIATYSGELYCWNPESGELDSVGCVSSGITGMSWSPDFEVVVITTGEQKFIIMTGEFDPILEGDIHSREFGEATQVNVGWGKKETQFHGSAGKPTTEDLKPPEVNPVLRWDDQRARISWHGDASFFAINAVEQDTGIRKIRIWSKEGVLFSTNEALDGLEQAICWRPSGRVVASTQRKQNKHDVIFFEKNGLRHGEFTLPFGTHDVKVVEMAWNSTSDMLAIWILEIDEAQDSNRSFIQIWTCGNYHWYLKQELVLGVDGDNISAMLWDPESNGKIHILCQSGLYRSYNWVPDVYHSVGLSDDNISTVAVIDGRNALLTPFKLLVTPPPMAAQTLKFPEPINQLSFGPEGISSSFAVLLSDGSLITAIAMETDSKHRMPAYRIHKYGRIHPESFDVHHLLWTRNDCVLFSAPSKDGKDFSIVQIKLLGNETEEPSHKIQSTVPFGGAITSMFRHPDANLALIVSKDGEVFQYSCDKSSVTPYNLQNGRQLTMAQCCPRMEALSVDDVVLIFGLSEHYRLYMNGIEIANNCTSFALHEEFLVMTTLEHKCRCILLQSLKKYTDNSAQPEELEEGIRAVERGSKIVSAVINDSKVVLQMPRGNLETIHPRALVVSSLKKRLSSLQYKAAMTSMKRHRINLNLICDHDMKLFLDNIDEFVQQVREPNDLNLFLADLSAEDVTKTLYKPYYVQETKASAAKNQGGKKDTDLLCKRSRETFEKLDPQKYMLCILTTYVMQSNKDLDSALLLIKTLKENQREHSGDKGVTWEKALKYLLYLVDVNEMYNVALGLYDFDLVLIVAEKSQKDPKEYLPYLNNLKKMEVNYRKFQIDLSLKRYNKALQHIVKAGVDHFDECLKLVIDHRLYQEALKLYDKESAEYKELSLAYGNQLVDEKKFYDAGVVFNRCHLYKEALDSFSRGLYWPLAISTAFKLKMSDIEISSLSRKMSVDLKSKKRYGEAATLLDIYAKDSEEAIVTLIEGHRWAEALCMIHRCEREDLIETNLRPSLLEEFQNTVTLISDMKRKFIKYQKRLLIVREEKRKREAELIANENFHDDPENELFSDVSSITGQSTVSTSSRSSRSSGHSSKSRRKTQRKKFSLKEGSQHEDFALMEALAEVVNTCDSMQGEVKETLQTLALLEYETEAESLQSSFHGLYSHISSQIDPIWKPRPIPGRTIQLGPDASVNSLVSDMNNLTTTASSYENPDLPEPTRAVLTKNIQWSLSIVATHLDDDSETSASITK